MSSDDVDGRTKLPLHLHFSLLVPVTAVYTIGDSPGEGCDHDSRGLRECVVIEY